MLNPYIEAHELRDLVLKKEVRPRDVAESLIARVEKLNPKLGAFMTITPERAIADADRIEKMSETEQRRAQMFGVPYSIKDLDWTKDIPTSMGSKNYEHFRPPADDEVVIRMRNAVQSVTLKLAHDYARFKRICARHGIEISATRVRKVVKHFEAEREKTRAWRKILEQTTSTLLRQSAQD